MHLQWSGLYNTVTLFWSDSTLITLHSQTCLFFLFTLTLAIFVCLSVCLPDLSSPFSPYMSACLCLQPSFRFSLKRHHFCRCGIIWIILPRGVHKTLWKKSAEQWKHWKELKKDWSAILVNLATKQQPKTIKFVCILATQADFPPILFNYFSRTSGRIWQLILEAWTSLNRPASIIWVQEFIHTVSQSDHVWPFKIQSRDLFVLSLHAICVCEGLLWLPWFPPIVKKHLKS